MLPPSAPNGTEYLVVHGSRITKLCDFPKYPTQVEALDLSGNKISTVCKSFFEGLAMHGNMKSLDVANNQIKTLPKEVKNMNLSSITELQLSGNPFQCDYSMAWMREWILDNKHVIKDYKDMRCHNGNLKGKPIYSLDMDKLGSQPSKWTLAKKVGVWLSVTIAIISVILLMVLIAKKFNEIKFFLYYHFNFDTIPKDHEDDTNENMENMCDCHRYLYDAYISYR